MRTILLAAALMSVLATGCDDAATQEEANAFCEVVYDECPRPSCGVTINCCSRDFNGCSLDVLDAAEACMETAATCSERVACAFDMLESC